MTDTDDKKEAAPEKETETKKDVGLVADMPGIGELEEEYIVTGYMPTIVHTNADGKEQVKSFAPTIKIMASNPAEAVKKYLSTEIILEPDVGFMNPAAAVMIVPMVMPKDKDGKTLPPPEGDPKKPYSH